MIGGSSFHLDKILLDYCQFAVVDWRQCGSRMHFVLYLFGSTSVHDVPAGLFKVREQDLGCYTILARSFQAVYFSMLVRPNGFSR